MGKSNWEEMVSDTKEKKIKLNKKYKKLKNLAHKGCKIAAQKYISFLANFALLAGFFCNGSTLRVGWEILCLSYAGF